jgi:hypothetical protein
MPETTETNNIYAEHDASNELHQENSPTVFSEGGSLVSHETFGEPSKKKHLARNLLIAGFLVLNLGMGAASADILVINKNKPDANPTNQTSSTVAPKNTIPTKQTVAAKTDTPASQTLHYVSKPLDMEFDYPIDWRIDSDSSNKHIEISSPTIDITDSGGKSEKARVQINVDNKYPKDILAIVDDSSTIAASSEQIKYQKPTKVQRKSTNLSFATLDGLSKGNITSLFISGNLTYAPGELVKSKNYKSINPFVSVYFNTCPDGGCHALSLGNTSAEDYKTNPIFTQLRKIIQSMRFN